MIRSVCTILFLIFLLTFGYSSQAEHYSYDFSISQPAYLDSLSLFYYRSINIDPDDTEKHLSRLRRHIQKLQKRLDKDGPTEYLLKSIFFKTHEKFLKDYENVVSYDRLITEGKYNCISGSALYVTILGALNIPHKIFETEEHVFLMVYAGEKRYLFESTDPLNGFVTNEKSIATHLAGFTDEYSTSELQQVGSGDSSYNRVGLKSVYGLPVLAGLQYYNEAVVSFNKGRLSEAYRLAIQGYNLYPSDRLVNCMDTILESIMSNEMISKETKASLQKQHITYLNK